MRNSGDELLIRKTARCEQIIIFNFQDSPALPVENHAKKVSVFRTPEIFVDTYLIAKYKILFE